MATNKPYTNAFATKLLSEPCFRDGTLTLYADVPVKCIRYTQPLDTMADTCFGALNWVPEVNYCTGDLRKLLDMPLSEFFSMRKDSLHFLTQYFPGARRLPDIPADREFTTYGDCLELLAAIRKQLPLLQTWRGVTTRFGCTAAGFIPIFVTARRTALQCRSW